MEKAKRLSKSSIAVIVLAILLALSLVMGLTGAWFTDHDGLSDSDTLRFGQVEVTAESDTGSGEDGTFDVVAHPHARSLFVPGDTVSVDEVIITNAGTVDAYVEYKYDLTITATVDNREYDLSDVRISGAEEAAKVFVRSAGYTQDSLYELQIWEPTATYTIPSYVITMNQDTHNLAIDSKHKIVYALNRAHDEEVLFNAGNTSDLIKARAAFLEGYEIDDYAEIEGEGNSATYSLPESGGWTIVDLSNVEVKFQVDFVVKAIQVGNLTAAALNAYFGFTTVDAQYVQYSQADLEAGYKQSDGETLGAVGAMGKFTGEHVWNPVAKRTAA